MSSPKAKFSKSGTIGEDNGEDARRKKKRELDRRCQRIGRERTKTRLLELEKMVEQLSRPDTNSQVAFLMQQLSDVCRERDALSKTMANIATLSRGKMAEASKQEPIHVPGNAIATAMDTTSSGSRSSWLLDFDENSFAECLESGDPKQQQLAGNDLNFLSASYNPGDLAPPITPVPLSMYATTVTPIEMGRGTIQDLQLEENGMDYQSPIFQRHTSNLPFPSNCTICEIETKQPKLSLKKPPNLWRFANQVLTRPQIGEAGVSSPMDDIIQENVAVQAILEGWDSVGRFEDLSPSWQKLRLIDEQLFSSCAKVERLAILRIMHKNLQLDANPTPERRAKVPPWYLKRPSQSVIEHAYAIDFFAWPGMRERFVFFEHKYCANLFWQLFCASFRMLWPFEFRDCYTRHTVAGLYQISPHFDHRINDLQCWTFGPDIFAQYPEFYDDALPLFNHIPSTLSVLAPCQIAPASRVMTKHGVASAAEARKREEEIACHRSNYNFAIKFPP